MARVTVEDCLDRIQNQFELTMVASKRARQLARGANAHLPWEDDKTTVMALREVAEGLVGPGILEEADAPAMAVAEEEQAEEAPLQAPEADAEEPTDDEAKPASE